MARITSFFLILASVVLICTVGTLGASVISSSTLDNCFRDSNGTDVASGLNCTNQIVVQVSVDQNDAGTTEIQATIQGALSNGTAVTLENDISVKIYKSPVNLVYPLFYLKTVNSKPYEQIYQRGWSMNPPPCYDGTSAKSTCGWYTNSTNDKIPYSNGFCCRCNFDGVVHKDDVTRGSLDCNPFGMKMSSAHCLRMSESWWDVFAVDGYTMTYQIILEVSGPGITTYNLTLDQSTPFAKSNNNFMSARIVGDFPAATRPPAYDSYYLAVMASPADPIYAGGTKNWMMVPREMFDFSGTSCNKIGISWEGFYSQGQRCGVYAGSCLSNQLADLYLADDALRALNKTPTYLLSRWGSFTAATDDTYYTLAFQPTGISNTLLSLFLNADSIRVVTNRSTGKIASASIDNFTTFSRDGKLYVTAANTGALTATYYLTVTNMSIDGILKDIPAQSSSIAPLQSWSTVFDLHAQNRYSSNDWATVTLYDASLDVIDTVTVFFNTTMYVPDYGAQGGNTTTTGSYFFQNDGQICLCTTPLSLCFLMHFSTCAKLLGWLLVLVIPIVAIILWRCCCPKCGCCPRCKKAKRRRQQPTADEETGGSARNRAAPPSDGSTSTKKKKDKVKHQRDDDASEVEMERINKNRSSTTSQLPSALEASTSSGELEAAPHKTTPSRSNASSSAYSVHSINSLPSATDPSNGHAGPNSASSFALKVDEPQTAVTQASAGHNAAKLKTPDKTSHRPNASVIPSTPKMRMPMPNSTVPNSPDARGFPIPHLFDLGSTAKKLDLSAAASSSSPSLNDSSASLLGNTQSESNHADAGARVVVGIDSLASTPVSSPKPASSRPHPSNSTSDLRGAESSPTAQSPNSAAPTPNPKPQKWLL